MPRPGVDVVITEPTPVRGAMLDMSRAFFLGTPARGPVDRALQIQSLREYERRYGPRSGDRTAHDAVRAFFTERGGVMHFLRVSGPNAESAGGTLGPFAVTAESPGTWGNDLRVGLEVDTSLMSVSLSLPPTPAPEPMPPGNGNGDGEGIEPASGRRAAGARRRASSSASARATGAQAREGDGNGNGDGEPATPSDEPQPAIVRVVVYQGETRVERSGPFRRVGEAVVWSENTSDFVRLATSGDESALLTPLEPVSLSGGIDDVVTDGGAVSEALKLLPRSMGPGQVLFPGQTSFGVHVALCEHCEQTRRVCLLDLSWEEGALSTTSDITLLHGVEGARYACALAPALRYPGPAAGTYVNVPYSAVQAGIIARADRETGNPNEAAAGVMGQSLGARGLAVEYTDEQRTDLNELGVTLARMTPVGLPFPRSGVRTYGSRTAAGPDQPNWIWFPGSRTVMAIAHECESIAENYVHRQIDARRRIFAELEQDLGGVCGRFYNLGALYGEEAGDAFEVDAQTLNDENTIAAGEIHAIVRIRTSPSSEWVVIEIQRYPVSQEF